MYRLPFGKADREDGGSIVRLSKILPFAITLITLIIIGSVIFCSTCREIPQMEAEVWMKTPPQGISPTIAVVLVLLFIVIIMVLPSKEEK